MSDARLRELERQAADGPEANARYLAELIRQGYLSRGRVKLAARLGHQAARLATGERESVDWSNWSQRWRAISNSHDLLSETFPARLAADFAGHVLPLFEERYPDDDRPRLAIEAARRWAEDPSEENRRAADDAADAAADAAYAAYDAADAAADAAFNAAYAAAADAGAAYNAAYAAAYAADYAGARDSEYTWQRDRLIFYLLTPESLWKK